MTKLDIVSGFLGAGKTTLIKKLLEEVFQDEKIVLVENEYGEVGIDGGFLKDAGIEIKELNSGCICCSLVGDFSRSLDDVMTKYNPDRIIIEPSGVAKLSDVIKSAKDMEQTHDVQLNALVVVVNGNKVSKQMKAFGEFFNNQIENATTIVVSRTQMMDEPKLELAVENIRSLNDKAAVITTPWDELSGQFVLETMENQGSNMADLLAELEKEAHHHEHEHHHHDHEEHPADCTCGCHDHEHEHEHHHDHHEHEHHHHHEHEHHHDHDHDHHEHDHHDHHEHEHHHHHDHEEHPADCTCGCHDHDHEHHHHHHHDAADVFTSWGKETPHKFTREKIEEIMKLFCDSEEYGVILRSKGMVPAEDGTWIYFDMVPGEYEIREGQPDYTGKLCVIGTGIDEHKMEEIFGI